MKDKEQDAWVRGFACCLANVLELESYILSDIRGGMTMNDFKKAGVEKYDLDRLHPHYEALKKLEN